MYPRSELCKHSLFVCLARFFSSGVTAAKVSLPLSVVEVLVLVLGYCCCPCSCYCSCPCLAIVLVLAGVPVLSVVPTFVIIIMLSFALVLFLRLISSLLFDEFFAAINWSFPSPLCPCVALPSPRYCFHRFSVETATVTLLCSMRSCLPSAPVMSVSILAHGSATCRWGSSCTEKRSVRKCSLPLSTQFASFGQIDQLCPRNTVFVHTYPDAICMQSYSRS